VLVSISKKIREAGGSLVLVNVNEDSGALLRGGHEARHAVRHPPQRHMIGPLNEPRADQTEGRVRRANRDAEIVQRYVLEGARVQHLARDYRITAARVQQILRSNNAERPDAARSARFSTFFDVIRRDHMKAVATARLQVSQGWAVDVTTRVKLGELYDALDRALDEEGA
jgi:hypothetical protein